MKSVGNFYYPIPNINAFILQRQVNSPLEKKSEKFTTIDKELCYLHFFLFLNKNTHK